MESKSSRHSIRDARDGLARLIDESPTRRDRAWYQSLSSGLERLEMALDQDDTETNRFSAIEEIGQSHPRLISTCRDLQSHGRKLLRQTALVVRLSARGYDVEKSPFPELLLATTSLIDAVERQLAMEGELRGEAAHDIGGEG